MSSESDKSIIKLVIIGSGPTALGALHRIHQLQGAGCLEQKVEVTVVERESNPGGLATTITDSNGFSWDLGVHVTGTSRYPEFLRVIYEAIPEWYSIRRCVKANMLHIIRNRENVEENYVPYPVQHSVQYLPFRVQQKCLEDLDKFDEKKSVTNFDEFSQKYFGKTLQDIFIRPYNEKVWTVKLEEMSCRWVEGRVPRIDSERLKVLCNTGYAPTSSSKNSQTEQVEDRTAFRYPGNCAGVGEIWKRFANTFPEEIFKFQHKVEKIDPIENKLILFNSDKTELHLHYDVLISSIPITELGRLSNLCPQISLKHSKVVLVGIGLQKPQSEFAQKLSWAYFPDPKTIFYRCTIISNFSPFMTPDPEKYWSVLCEIGMKPEDGVDENGILDQTVQDLILNGIIESEAQVYSKWIHILPYGYPIPTLNREEELRKCHKIFEDHNIFSRGRFGGWKYEISNQDHSFECGIQLVDKIFLGISETLYAVNE